jgi:hypothetical protein
METEMKSFTQGRGVGDETIRIYGVNGINKIEIGNSGEELLNDYLSRNQGKIKGKHISSIKDCDLNNLVLEDCSIGEIRECTLSNTLFLRVDFRETKIVHSWFKEKLIFDNVITREHVQGDDESADDEPYEPLDIEPHKAFSARPKITIYSSESVSNQNKLYNFLSKKTFPPLTPEYISNARRRAEEDIGKKGGQKTKKRKTKKRKTKKLNKKYRKTLRKTKTNRSRKRKNRRGGMFHRWSSAKVNEQNAIKKEAVAAGVSESAVSHLLAARDKYKKEKAFEDDEAAREEMDKLELKNDRDKEKAFEEDEAAREEMDKLEKEKDKTRWEEVDIDDLHH